MGINAKDLINSAQGTAFVTIEGRNIEMFYLKNCDATIDFDVADLKVLGKRMTGHKVIGMSGSGSMTIYAVTSDFIKLADTFKKSGKTPYFQMKVSTEDPESKVGRQTIMLFDVVPASIPLFGMDIDDPIIEQDIDFTFDDYDAPEKFKQV